jgi:hypothetical protein
MRCRTMLGFAPLVLVGCLSVVVYTQESVTRSSQTSLQQSVKSTTAAQAPTGIITDRLSPKDLQRWNSIERLVFAESEGQFLHPTLRGLWEWLETSGHTVYIVFIKPTANATSTAGQFRLEKLDPRGECHQGAIYLNLNNIDLAYVGRETWRAAGFIPFDQLSREERYAEVLGHEMAHAVDILTSLDRTARVEETIEKTNAMLLHHRSLKPTEQLTIELKHRLNHRDAMLKVLEATADKIEAQVWRELVRSKPLREKPGSLASW